MRIIKTSQKPRHASTFQEAGTYTSIKAREIRRKSAGVITPLRERRLPNRYKAIKLPHLDNH
jgi:hypothetical protein